MYSIKTILLLTISLVRANNDAVRYKPSTPEIPTPSSGGAYSPAAPANKNDARCQVLALTNTYRARKGRGALRGDTRLDDAAMAHCKRMAASNDLEHNIGGSTPGSRMEGQGYDWNACAENILYSSEAEGAKAAVDLWINSPGHEKNIVGQYQNMGSARCQAANGLYYWAQTFAAGDQVAAEAYTPEQCGAQPTSHRAPPTPPKYTKADAPPSTPPKYTKADAPPGKGKVPAPYPPTPEAPVTEVEPSTETTPEVVPAPPIKYGKNGRPCKKTPSGNKSVNYAAPKKSTAGTGAGIEGTPVKK